MKSTPKEFGLDRLVQTTSASADKDALYLLREIESAVEALTGEVQGSDDLTLLGQGDFSSWI